MDDMKPYEDDNFYDALGMRIWQQRHLFVDELITQNSYIKVLDLGCNDAKFLQRMSRSSEMKLLVGCDIDQEAISQAQNNLYPEPIQMTIKPYRKYPLEVYLYNANILRKYSLFKQFQFQVITLIEVIEHLQLEDLPKLESNVFGFLQTEMVIVTTPNRDFNHYFQKLKEFRHDDHKFEFTRQEFETWCQKVCDQYPYTYETHGVGWHKSGEKIRGACSQVAVFKINAEQSPELIEKFIYPFDNRSIEEKLIDEIKYQILTLEEEDLFYSEHKTWKKYKIEQLMQCHKIKELQKSEEDLLKILRQQHGNWIKIENKELWFLADESESEEEDQYE